MEGFLLGCFFNSTERCVSYQADLTEPQGKLKMCSDFQDSEPQARNEMEGFLLGCFFNSTERRVSYQVP